MISKLSFPPRIYPAHTLSCHPQENQGLSSDLREEITFPTVPLTLSQQNELLLIQNISRKWPSQSLKLDAMLFHMV